MKIKFSPVYKPLFQILQAWEVVNSATFKDDWSEEGQKYWLDLSQVDTILISGGRDSGKSFAMSCFNPIAATQYNHRVLYTRQTMSSTDNSISSALEERMELLKLSHKFDVANKTYTIKPKPNETALEKKNKGKISITGLKTSVGTQTAKTKSLENFSIFEVDEGEELESYASWNKTKRSLRAKDVQCLAIVVFNPPTKEHWLYEQFYESMNVEAGFNGVKDNILYIHSTYLDNLDNMADHNIREYELLKKSYNEYEALNGNQREGADIKLKKQWSQYKYEILGGFREIAEGVIYEDWKVGDFNPDGLPTCFGHDFGSNDPDATTEVAVDFNQKLIYVRECFFKNGIGSDELFDVLLGIAGYDNLIIGDAASKRLIGDLYRKGLNIRRCKKGAGSVLRRIKTIQGYTIIVSPESKNVKKALNNYSWHDKKAGIPLHDWSDLCDSFGYAAMDLIDY